MTSGGGFGGSFLHKRPTPPARSVPLSGWEAARSAARGAHVHGGHVRPPGPDWQIVQRACEHARRGEFSMTITPEEQRYLDEHAPHHMLLNAPFAPMTMGRPVVAIQTPHGAVILKVRGDA